MKFKSLFLTMLGAAAIVSCNNDAIDGGGNGNKNGDVVEGLPIYATMTIKAGSNNAATYAGSSDVNASTRETSVGDVAMYIYKADAAGFIPQCAVYLPNLPVTNKVTMKTTSGTKKIFVAANVLTNPESLAMTNVTGLGLVSSDMAPTFLLNDTLFSISPTAFEKGSPTTAPKTKADGLILNFAMGGLYGTGLSGTGGDALSYPNATAKPLMTNWDGPTDLGGTNNLSTCTFQLTQDVDSVLSETNATNHVVINVQREYAKVSLKFASSITKTTGVAITTPANLSTNAFAAGSGTMEGRFFPWGAGAEMYWSLGNIPTAQLPFQQFDANTGQYIRDVFYLMKNDSLLNPAHFNAWAQHYDNTRVFPMATMNAYPTGGVLTVTNVKNNMLVANNRTLITAESATDPVSADYKYAYTTESAREHPVMQDHQTYLITGGFYQPKSVTTDVVRAAVATNGVSSYTKADDYSWLPTAGDTLYYHSDDKVFIVGKKTLLGYYAWAKGKQATAGDPAPGGGTIPASSLNESDFNSTVVAAINADIAADKLFCYFEGQCWYRIYVTNNSAADPAAKVIVARNHIYDVTISSIKGPGIASPDEIIKPGVPVLELDTYVSASINVLNWHKVDQSIQVDSN